MIGGPIYGVINPKLALLADNGGPTKTMAPLPGSPVIDMGSNPDGLTTDQRGIGFARVVGAAADIGAYEVQTVVATAAGIPPADSSAYVVTSAADRLDTVFDPANLTLRDAVAEANANPGADTITFDPNLSGKTITLTLGELVITDSVALEGLGATNLSIDGANATRLFNINDGNDNTNIDVQIEGLTLTGGNAGTSAGGAIYSTEDLTVRDCTLTGNNANSGGGISTATSGNGHTLIQNSVFAGNSSLGGGGIDATTNDSATTTIQNCVFGQ